MHAHLTDAAFELTGIFQHLPVDLRTVLQFVLEGRDVFITVVEGDFYVFPFFVRQTVRNHLGQTVRFIYADVTDAGDILDGTFCRHRTEGNHPGDMVRPVGPFHVFVRHRQALEIHVDIGHVDAVRIEETLEQQIVFDRVEVGDFQAVRNDGTGGGTASGAYHRACGTRCGDIVLDDEKIVREAHAADGLEFEIDAFPLFVAEGFAIALAGAQIGQVAKVGNRRAERLSARISVFVTASFVDDFAVFLQVGVDFAQELGVDVEFREDIAAVDGKTLDLIGDFQGIGKHLRVVREEGGHLLRTLDIFLLGIAQAVRIVNIGVGGDTDKPVVRRAVLLADEVRVIGGNDLGAGLSRKGKDRLIDLALLMIDFPHAFRGSGDFRPVQLHLQIVIVPKHTFVPFDGLAGGVQVIRHDGLGDFPREAGGTADESLAVLFHQFVGDTGLVVEALGVSRGNEFHQVPVTGRVLCKQDQVIVFAVVAVLEMMVVVLRDIDLAAQDGLDARMLFCTVEELLDAVHVPVVGDGHGIHSKFFHPVKKFLDGRKTVQDGILCMNVEMYELCHNAKITKTPDLFGAGR